MRNSPCVPGWCGPILRNMKSASSLLALHPPLFGPEAQRFELLLLVLCGEGKRLHFGRPRRMVFAQGMTLPPGRHEEPPRVGVALKGDAEHIENFPFIPVGARPETGDGGHGGLPRRKRGLEAQIGIPVERKQMIDNGKGRLRLPAMRRGIVRQWRSGRRACGTAVAASFFRKRKHLGNGAQARPRAVGMPSSGLLQRNAASPNRSREFLGRWSFRHASSCAVNFICRWKQGCLSAALRALHHANQGIGDGRPSAVRRPSKAGVFRFLPGCVTAAVPP